MAIQVIRPTQRDRQPSKSEQLGQGFGRALGGLAEHLIGQNQKEARDRSYQELLGKDISGLDAQQQQELAKLHQQHQYARQLQELKGKQALELQGMKSNQSKVEEPDESRIIGQSAFDNIVGLLKKGNLGRGSGIYSLFGGETAKDTGKFNSLVGGLEAMLVDKVSRGTLSNTRFKYITETLLPKPTDTQEEIKGKLEGLAEILNLDASSLTGKSSMKNKERPGLEKFER